jgi:hypothetical protein
MPKRLGEILTALKNNADSIIFLGNNYRPNDDRLNDLTKIGEKLLQTPEYYGHSWTSILKADDFEVYRNYCLLMEIYISNNKCFEFIINKINDMDSQPFDHRKKALKQIKNLNMSMDLTSLTSSIVDTLDNSVDGNRICLGLASLLLNYYVTVVDESSERIGMKENYNEVIIRLGKSDSVCIKEYFSEIIDKEKGRERLVTNLNMFH